VGLPLIYLDFGGVSFTDMEILRLENLSKAFGGVQALSDVSFTLKGGEKLAIIGPNGAGKTTLLNILNGQLLPTGGRIFFLGKNITKMPIHYRALLGMARSFQITSLFPGLTALENIILALRGKEDTRIKLFRPTTSFKNRFDRAKESLIAVDLWERRDDLVQNISYGEQRKLEIQLCLVSEPKMLLLDEPTCGLTGTESADLINKIYNLGQDIPVIIVSHDMDLVFGLADRVIVLHQGKIVADGLPKEIKADPIVKDIYMGIEEDIGIARAT
jgi:branched-chain amino acid transport system ATP-binding protein